MICVNFNETSNDKGRREGGSKEEVKEKWELRYIENILKGEV